MATYDNATCHTHVHVHARVSAGVRPCVRVSAHECMTKEIAPFLGFSSFYYEHITYILEHLLDFFSCGTIFYFHMHM